MYKYKIFSLLILCIVENPISWQKCWNVVYKFFNIVKSHSFIISKIDGDEVFLHDSTLFRPVIVTVYLARCRM